MIQETLEEVRKVERTELFNSIFSVVKQIPRKDVECDAMDASSCSYEIEQLFYKWQQEQEKITTDDAYNEGFENGKHWQAERSYSEEELQQKIDAHLEAAENYAIDKQNENASKYYMALESFQEGAKWQAERMYSEEDMLKFAQKYSVNTLDKSHIEKFKKK